MHVTQQAKVAPVPRLSRLRAHRWSAVQRAIVIAVLAVIMGSLFVTSYSLALGDRCRTASTLRWRRAAQWPA